MASTDGAGNSVGSRAERSGNEKHAAEEPKIPSFMGSRATAKAVSGAARRVTGKLKRKRRDRGGTRGAAAKVQK